MIAPAPITDRPTLDPSLKIRDILDTLPKEVFVKNPRKAWLKVFVNVACVVLGYWAVAVSPWYLLPIAWIFLGTNLIGLFVLGHDCGHRSFSNQIWVNDLVGHIMFLPLIYPFHAWRIMHNHHHKHTNKLEEDNTWTPFSAEEYEQLSPAYKWWYQRMRGKFWWLGSVAHWAVLHFDWRRFTGKQREQVRFSVLLVVFTAAVGFPLILINFGIWGFVKFYIVPWLIYHFWMSTFTIVHHTLPSIPFTHKEQWHEAAAQLCGTVHCKYPWWVEFFCHDINVHIPHHLTTAIPWYNLRLAHKSIKANWGEYIHERKFSWPLIVEICDHCHLYNQQSNYQSFADHSRSNFN
ncbi:fatty acid desaturase [Xenococcus sp. PCC 7305]|uniref:fatty acid desaturase n=1 Tax=Xenococcus sp. PCC 7305 TaxID=102125 RepID=UPI0002AD0439|nr:fatty acid desaturase [Xenococcus sp. PCC 7305]ELS03490.1 fatty acid desaturase [Xenococcus sp. PCC 7305]